MAILRQARGFFTRWPGRQVDRAPRAGDALPSALAGPSASLSLHTADTTAFLASGFAATICLPFGFPFTADAASASA